MPALRISIHVTFVLLGMLVYVVSYAAGSYVDGKILLPYVTVGDDIYNITLELIPGSEPAELSLGDFSLYPKGTSIPEDSATFSKNVLSIPVILVGETVYKVSLVLVGSNFRVVSSVVTSTGTASGGFAYMSNILDGQLHYQILTNRDPNCTSYVGNYSAQGMQDRSNALPSAPSFPGTNSISEVNVDLVRVGGVYDNVVAWDYDTVAVVTAEHLATHCRLTSNMIPNHDFGWDVGSPNQENVWVTEIDQNDRQSIYIPVIAQMPSQSIPQDTRRDPSNYMDLDGILLNGVGIAMDSGFCYNPAHNRANAAGNSTGCGGLSVWYELPAYTIFDPAAVNMAAIFDEYFGHGFEGTYHYHAVTHPLQADDEQTVGPENGSPLIGFARDGFPIYGRWLVNASGDLVKAESAYILKTYALNGGNSRDPYEGLPANFDRGTPPTPWDLVNRPEDFETNFGLPLGRYEDDWVFDSTGNTGNLDMCNGATDINGDYGYYLTNKYPFTPPCVFGVVEPSFGRVPPLRSEDENYNDQVEQAINGH